MPWNLCEIERNDPILVQVVEQLGKKEASGGDIWKGGSTSSLKIVEIPDDVLEWHIEEYDGIERVVEKYRSWQ